MRKRKIYSLVAVTVASLSANCFADPFALTSGGEHGLVILDMDMITKDSRHSIVWETKLLVKPVTVNGQRLQVIKTQLKIDCDLRTIQRVYIIGKTDNDGWSAGSYMNEHPRPVVPDSSDTDTKRLACEGASSTDVMFEDMAHAERTFADLRVKDGLKD
ncbi:MAG: hypothetical protein ABI668_02195 [Sphingorhabdus sp.]